MAEQLSLVASYSSSEESYDEEDSEVDSEVGKDVEMAQSSLSIPSALDILENVSSPGYLKTFCNEFEVPELKGRRSPPRDPHEEWCKRHKPDAIACKNSDDNIAKSDIKLVKDKQFKEQSKVKIGQSSTEIGAGPKKGTAKERVKGQRLKGQSGIGSDFKTWKSEEEMRQRQQYD